MLYLFFMKALKIILSISVIISLLMSMTYPLMSVQVMKEIEGLGYKNVFAFVGKLDSSWGTPIQSKLVEEDVVAKDHIGKKNI